MLTEEYRMTNLQIEIWTQDWNNEKLYGLYSWAKDVITIKSKVIR
jgi:hypothetical protein